MAIIYAPEEADSMHQPESPRPLCIFEGLIYLCFHFLVEAVRDILQT